MREVSVIILNWNEAQETLGCLDSLLQARQEGADVIVVDNGSTDDSTAIIRSACPEVTLVEAGANLGFAEGNNAGIRRALARGAHYVFILNNDARVAPDTLGCLLDAARQSPQAAFFGPKILDREASGMLQSTGMRLDYWWRSHHRDAGEPDRPGELTPQPVECLSGAALFVRAATLDRIGLLDPDFYLYREDVDWCLRARRLGYQILFVPGARVWHRSHAAHAEALPRITYYMARNSLLLVQKHRGGWVRLSGLLLRQLITTLSWTIRPRWRHRRRERDALLQGISDFFHHRSGQGPI